MFRRFTVFSVSALTLVLALPLALAAMPANAGGVDIWNHPVCGSGYIPVDLGHGNYFNVYNAPDGSTCINSERRNLKWYIESKKKDTRMWEYPNISSGIEFGRYTCYDGRSAYPTSPGSQCMRYPVEEKNDGTPLTSVTYWPHLKRGDVAYDIWFSKKYAKPQDIKRPDGAEIMIWLAHPGISLNNYNIWYYVRIEGRRYAVIHWITHPRSGGPSWNYISYIALKQTGHLNREWLNPFFRDAIRHGWLRSDWWLTAIDFGTEMNCACAGFAVRSYSLQYVR